jgi:hypothetical protein
MMSAHPHRRYDRTLRVVMWLDALLSLAVVLVCLFALPAIVMLDVSGGPATSIGITVIALSVLLAGLGSVTGVALALRMNAGDFTLPAHLRLPLPAPLHPDIS